jgi:alanine racemase
MYSQPALHQDYLPPHLTTLMEIDTQAIAENYKTLCSLAQNSSCAAVVKANAYGFGLQEVSSLLQQEGCQDFFVAHLEEAIFLKTTLKNANIYVLSGLLPETAEFFVNNSLIPVLNDFGMLEYWAYEAKLRGKKLPCVLHIDTGMHRNGFDRKDTEKLFSSLEMLTALEPKIFMSHLASSHDPKDPLNEQQRRLFESLQTQLPSMKASLADTGGIYLGSAFHYDMVRTGKGLFGLYPSDSLRPCLNLRARILQIRTALKGESVGYGATHLLTRESKLATLGIGFVDGYDRRLSNKGYVLIQGFKAPIVGRISMDYTVVDVTDIPESEYYAGSWVELVNDTLSLDMLAHEIGTISRELSTRLGNRITRLYR